MLQCLSDKQLYRLWRLQYYRQVELINLSAWYIAHEAILTRAQENRLIVLNHKKHIIYGQIARISDEITRRATRGDQKA